MADRHFARLDHVVAAQPGERSRDCGTRAIAAVRLLLGIALLPAILCPAGLEAQAAPPRARPNLVRNWIDRIDSADQEVRSGDYKGAKRSMNRVLDEMCGRIHSGEGVGELLGMAAAVRGLAEAGLGNDRDARWDWEIAKAMAPRFAELDLSAYGEAGELLREKAEEPQHDETADEDESATTPTTGDVTPPVKFHGPIPKYPGARLQSCLEDVLVVQAVIDKDGLTRSPKILSSPSEVASFAVLDILRKWRFKPATLMGEPLAVLYNLSVNFEVPYCRDALARWRRRQAEERADED